MKTKLVPISETRFANDRLLSSREVMARLDISRQQLERLRKKNLIVGFRSPLFRKVLYPESSVNEFIQSATVGLAATEKSAVKLMVERVEREAELRHMEMTLRVTRCQLREAEARLSLLKQYAPPPPPTVDATKTGAGLPALPGVYFVWCGEEVVYVGQSRDINSRCSLGKHDHLCEGDRVSWLLFPIEQLRLAEAFYIGLLHPSRNSESRFGQQFATTLDQCDTVNKLSTNTLECSPESTSVHTQSRRTRDPRTGRFSRVK